MEKTESEKKKNERNLWKMRYPEKDKAHESVYRAVRKGKILKLTSCSMCHKDFPRKQIHGHHDDYSNKLAVRWVCFSCHNKLHVNPKTHCVNGHEYTEENTYINPRGNKECRTCRKTSFKKYMQKTSLLFLMLVVLVGCDRPPEMKKDLKDFNEVACKDYCITSFFSDFNCTVLCELRGKYKKELEAK